LHKDKPKRDLGDLRHWTESKNIDEDGSYTGGRNWQGDDEANYPTRVTPKRNVGRRNLGDVEGIPKVADVDAQTQAVDDFSSEHPVPASLQQKLQKIPRWLWDTYLDASQSMGRGVMDAGKTVVRGVTGGVQGAGRHLYGELKGIGDFGKRRYDAAKAIMNSSYTIEDANIILEDWELVKQEQLNDIRRLSGLKEAIPGSMSVKYGKNQWRVEQEDNGWQVYIWSDKNNDWIAQGQPHSTQAEAEADAKSFFD
jgi:hypothetical protein